MRTFRAAAALLLALPLAAQVTVRFDADTPEVGPFPTDALTVSDPEQRTGRRVNLPLPDCRTQASTCLELGEINRLDGFHIAPHVRVRFSGAVNPDSLRDGILLVWRDRVVPAPYSIGRTDQISRINQVAYDATTNTAYAKPDEILDPQRRYALVVTDAVRDAQGNAIQVDAAMQACFDGQAGGEYCRELAGERAQVGGLLPPDRRVVAMSLFTTLSTTSFLQGARERVTETMVTMRPAAVRTAFPLADVAAMTWRQQLRSRGELFRNVPLPLEALPGVGRVVFSSYVAPQFAPEVTAANSREVLPIATEPTARTVAPPSRTETVSVVTFLPTTPAPAGGYPVVVMGHGLSSSVLESPFGIAASLAAAGYATVGINAVGHGLGPDGQVLVRLRDGQEVSVPVAGRAADTDNSGEYQAFEGCLQTGGTTANPAPVLVLRDCLRQTALDLVQLVRALQATPDLDGDGQADVNARSVSYVGQSLGAMYGTLFAAVEPSVGTTVLNAGGGPVAEIARLSTSLRPLTTLLLGLRVPALLNRGFGFDSGYVPRYAPVLVVREASVVALQEFFERLEWLHAPGDPLSYAPHLRQATLPGVPLKRVLFQAVAGDTIVPSTASTRWILAAYGQPCTSVFRFDLLRQTAPTVPVEDGHSFLLRIAPGPLQLPALAAQQQVVQFLADPRFDGASCVPEVTTPGAALFEKPEFLL